MAYECRVSNVFFFQLLGSVYLKIIGSPTACMNIEYFVESSSSQNNSFQEYVLFSNQINI